jgi:hypothetical protein
MKKCAEIQVDLSAYIDNELTTARRTVVEEHIEACDGCRRRVAELKQVTAGVVALSQLQPPPGFLSAVRRKIAGDLESVPRGWPDYLFRPLWLKIPLGSLAAIAIVAIVIHLGSPTHAPVSESEQTKEAPVEEPAAAAGVASTDKLAPTRLVGSAAPTEASEKQKKTASYVFVLATENVEDAQGRVREIVGNVNGRILPAEEGSRSIDGYLVELPSANLEKFRAALQPARLFKDAPQASAASADAANRENPESSVVVEVQFSKTAE